MCTFPMVATSCVEVSPRSILVSGLGPQIPSYPLVTFLCTYVMMCICRVTNLTDK